MKNCKQCNSSLANDKLTFCNQSCSAKYHNARRKEQGWTHSPETLELLRISGKKTGGRSWANATRTPETLEKWKSSVKKGWKQKYASKSFDELSIGKKRDRLISEQQGKCADCGLSEWKSQPISLELDHKDGNTDNNSRENLWMICPNCHSTTDTWRGRNKPRLNGENKVDDATLIVALQSHSTIRKALLSVGLAAKGGNYDRAKELSKFIKRTS